ncbi:MAG: PQQ-binding-like beta-propeller repeat protein, partial [Gemmatimonadaceae bacterium]
RQLPAVLQATKSGMLFVLDRETGKPIVPVQERAVPASTVPGEAASKTQPFSTLPPLVPLHVDASSAFGLDSADRAACRTTMSALRNDGPFTPPSLEGTLVTPSNIGGAHWGGVAFDATRQLAIIPVNDVAAVVQLIPRDSFDGKREDGWEYAQMRGTPYLMRRRILLSPKGVPCTPPPFGTLVAMDIAAGTVRWRVPLGTPGTLGGRLAPVRGAQPVPGPGAEPVAKQTGEQSTASAASAASAALGSPNLGGAIVTGGGVVFIGATLDRSIRAFDVDSGRELWRADLPAGGKATPMTYASAGRKFVVIAAGGDGDVFGKGDEIVAFALP